MTPDQVYAMTADEYAAFLDYQNRQVRAHNRAVARQAAAARKRRG